MKRRTTAEIDAILQAGKAFVDSLPYKVSLREVFYHLLQKGLLRNKADYGNWKGYATDARKDWRFGWRPDTLIDGGREIIVSASPSDAADQLATLPYYIDIRPDLYSGQAAVPFLIYEAGGSTGQFSHHAPWCDHAPLRGDASVPHKWAIAERIAELAECYGLPVHVGYFGDYDPKGMKIPQSAMADVLPWIERIRPGTEVMFTRFGLNEGDNVRYDIPEKPEKPGTYEWQALTPEQGEAVIKGALSAMVDMDEIERRIGDAEADTMELRTKVADALEALL